MPKRRTTRRIFIRRNRRIAGWGLIEKREFILNLQTSVIYRKGARSAKDAKKIKDMPEVPEGSLIVPTLPRGNGIV